MALALDFDEIASGAPAWYAEVSVALGREDNKAVLELVEGRPKDGYTLRAASKAYLMRGDKDAALRAAEEALAAFHDAGNVKGEAAAQHQVARVKLASSQNAETIDSAEEALGLFREAHDPVGEAAVLNTMARCYLAKQEPARAGRVADEALILFKRAGERNGEAATLSTKLEMSLAMRLPQQATQVVADLRDLYAALGDSCGEGTALLLGAQASNAMGEYRDARMSAVEAADTFERAGERKKKAAAFKELATASLGEGLIDEALKAGNEAIGLFKDLGDRGGEAGANMALGDVYSAMGDIGKSANKAEEAANIYRKMKDKAQEAPALAKLADIHLAKLQAMGDGSFGASAKDHAKKESLRAAQGAYRLYKEMLDTSSSNFAWATQSLGSAMLANDNPSEALARAEESKELFQRHGDGTGVSNALTVMAQSHFALQDFDSAIKFAKKAKGVAAEIGDENAQASAAKLISFFEGSKPRPASTGVEYADIGIIGGHQKKIVQFNAFESRQVRRAVGASGPMSRSGSGPGAGVDAGPALFAVRWVRKEAAPASDGPPQLKGRK